ncbi:MAG: L,D-transpeptidase [Actinomycetota bacterium]
MRGMQGSSLRASALATALGALLAVTTPVTARLVGEHTAATPGRVRPALDLAAPAVRDGGPQPARVAGGPRPLGAPAIASTTTAPDRASSRPSPYLGVHVPAGGIVAHRNPWASSPTIGTVASASKYYGVPLVAWVERTNRNGTWGLVTLPYVWPQRDGWIRLAGLARETTWIEVRVDLSSHRVVVTKRDEVLYRISGGTGAPASPTPPGDYFVTDRVPFAAGSALGTFAFGISGIQPRLPAGWTGGDQLAIHGTNEPWTIGRSASAGCVHISEWAIGRFEPILRLGTPVVIRP